MRPRSAKGRRGPVLQQALWAWAQHGTPSLGHFTGLKFQTSTTALQIVPLRCRKDPAVALRPLGEGGVPWLPLASAPTAPLYCSAAPPLPPLLHPFRVCMESRPARHAHPAAPMFEVPSAKEEQRPGRLWALGVLLLALAPGKTWQDPFSDSSASSTGPTSASVGFLCRGGAPPLSFVPPSPAINSFCVSSTGRRRLFRPVPTGLSLPCVTSWLPPRPETHGHNRGRAHSTRAGGGRKWGSTPFCPDGSSWGEAKPCLSCPISWVVGGGCPVLIKPSVHSPTLPGTHHPRNWPPAASGMGRRTLAAPSPITAPRQRWMGDVGTEFICGLVQDKELLQQQRQQLSPHPLCSWANGGVAETLTHPQCVARHRRGPLRQLQLIPGPTIPAGVSGQRPAGAGIRFGGQGTAARRGAHPSLPPLA